MNISLAITYFNKSKFISECLNEYVLNEDRINVCPMISLLGRKASGCTGVASK